MTLPMKKNFFFLSSYPHSTLDNSLNVFFQFWMQSFRLGARPLGGGRTGMGAGGSPCRSGRISGDSPPAQDCRGYRLRPRAGRRGDNAPKRHLCPRITGAKGVNLRYAWLSLAIIINAYRKFLASYDQFAISAASGKFIYAAIFRGYLSIVFSERGGAASPLPEEKRVSWVR